MTSIQRSLSPRGSLKVRKIPAPKAPLSWRVRNMTRMGFIEGRLAYSLGGLLQKTIGVQPIRAKLSARLIKADGSVINYGVLGYKQVTTAFVEFLVDNMQVESAEWGDFKFHDSGVGSTAEAIGDTDIETTDGEARVSGTQVDGASANIYRSVGTIAYTTTKIIREHGVFSIVTAGTMMDRTVFAAINVDNGDSIEFTYEITFPAGS